MAEQGYTQPTPIQTLAIPVVLAGRDLLAAAQTGTGKTAGFMLPILQCLSTQPREAERPRVLVLVPTRELAAQVHAAVRDYGRHLQIRSAVVFGGVSMNNQVDELDRGVDIVVATPGRLLDHAGGKTIDLAGITTLVLDEADRMLDMGFIHDIRRVLTLLPAARQNLLFSATFSDPIRELAGTFLHNPVSVEVAPRNTPVELIAQVAHPVDRDRRRALLTHLIKTGDWRQVLVFTRTKHGANRLAEQLTRDGVEADAIHGNKSQGARTRALQRFKESELRVLVATDIAARGLDIEGLPHVVNYDLPNVAEDYVHRIGRTGRAGSNGEAVALVCGEERELFAVIETLMQRTVERKVVAGFEPGPGYETARFDPDQARGRGEPREPREAREPREPRNGPAQGQGRSQGRNAPRDVRQGEPRRSGGPDGARGPRSNSGSGGNGATGGSGNRNRPPRPQAGVAEPRHAEGPGNEDDIDSIIDGNRIDYRGNGGRPNPGGTAGNDGRGYNNRNYSGGDNGPGGRRDFRGGQRGPRPAPVLEGPMTWRGEPVSRRGPPEPHESRLHEAATRPQGSAKPGSSRKRHNGVLLTGLPRDED